MTNEKNEKLDNDYKQQSSKMAKVGQENSKLVSEKSAQAREIKHLNINIETAKKKYALSI